MYIYIYMVNSYIEVSKVMGMPPDHPNLTKSEHKTVLKPMVTWGSPISRSPQMTSHPGITGGIIGYNGIFME